MRGRTGAAVAVHERDAAVRARGQGPGARPQHARRPAHAPPRASPRRPRSTRSCTDGQVLDVAGGLRVVHTPGHTPGHVALLHEPSRRADHRRRDLERLHRMRWPLGWLCTDAGLNRRPHRRSASRLRRRRLHPRPGDPRPGPRDGTRLPGATARGRLDDARTGGAADRGGRGVRRRRPRPALGRRLRPAPRRGGTGPPRDRRAHRHAAAGRRPVRRATTARARSARRPRRLQRRRPRRRDRPPDAGRDARRRARRVRRPAGRRDRGGPRRRAQQRPRGADRRDRRDRPGRRRRHDRRQRRHPPGQAADRRPPPRPGGAPAARARRRGRRRHLPGPRHGRARPPAAAADRPAGSRQLAAAQTIAVVEAGGRTVSLGDLLGPEFAASPAEMFSADRFHPSVAGYASAAAVLLPSVCAALGLWRDGGRRATRPPPRRGRPPDVAGRGPGRGGARHRGGRRSGRRPGPRAARPLGPAAPPPRSPSAEDAPTTGPAHRRPMASPAAAARATRRCARSVVVTGG